MPQARYFLALCEEQNFTRAAKRCGVAQPQSSEDAQEIVHLADCARTATDSYLEQSWLCDRKHETPGKWLEEVMDQALRTWTNLSFKSDIDFQSCCIFSLLGLVLSFALLQLTDADMSFLLFAG